MILPWSHLLAALLFFSIRVAIIGDLTGNDVDEVHAVVLEGQVMLVLLAHWPYFTFPLWLEGNSRIIIIWSTYLAHQLLDACRTPGNWNKCTGAQSEVY